MAGRARLVYRFGRFELDPGAYRLARDGEPQRIEPRVLELIAHLVEHRDRLVPKEELLSVVWQGRAVTDAVLARAVHGARTALGETSDDPEWIVTVHGRGYRFGGDAEVVRSAEGPSAPTTARRRRKIVAGLALAAVAAAAALGLWLARDSLALPPDRSVALLPFVNATGQEADDWVELGLMDLVATRMARDHGLEVVPTAQTLSGLQDLDLGLGDGLEPGDLERIRRALGTAFVLTSVVGREVGLYRLDMTVHGGPSEVSSHSMTGGDLFVVARQLTDALVGRVSHAAVPLGGPSAEAQEALAAGIHQLLSGHPSEARLLFERALDHDPDLAEARYRLGVALRDLGLHEEASELASEVLAAARSAGDVALEAQAEKLLGDLALLGGNYDEARRRFARTRDLFSQAGEVRGQILAETSLATVGLQRHDWAEAREHSARALEAARDIGWAGGMAEIEHTLGVLAGRSGELARADVHFSHALELSREIGNRRGEARALHNLGSNAQNRGDWDRAEELHRQALRLRREQRDVVATARSLVNLAVTGTWRGTLRQAEGDATEALEVFQELGNPRGEAMAWTVKAYVAKGRGEWPEARGSMERALEIWRELDVAAREALCLATLAEIADEEGDATTAERLAADAHRRIVELGDRNLTAYTLRVRARAAAVGGRVAEAEALFREALGIARDVGNEGIEGSIATDHADLLLDLDRPDEAAPFVDLLRERLPQSGPVTLLAARLAIARGDRAEGCRLAELARERSHELWDEEGELVRAGCGSSAVDA